MKKRMIFMAMLCLSLLLLSGCSGTSESEQPSESTEEVVEEIPAGAILPVFEDEEKGIKSRVIKLRDFDLKLPEGYVYGKIDYEVENQAKKINTYTTYYVWMDNVAEREYVFATDTCVMLYIYEGVDTNSPIKELNDGQKKTSIQSYMNYFLNMLTVSYTTYDSPYPIDTSGAERSVFSFTGKSGDYITTTNGDICHPKSYYGYFLMDNEVTDGSNRNFDGFVFSNDDTGEIFRESEYNDIVRQIRSAHGITEFCGGLLNAEIESTNGLSYNQLVDEVILRSSYNDEVLENGVFYKTLLYYVTVTGREYERWNVDGAPKPTPVVKEEPEATEEALENSHVHDDSCCGLICGETDKENHSHSVSCCGFICEYADEESGTDE